MEITAKVMRVTTVMIYGVVIVFVIVTVVFGFVIDQFLTEWFRGLMGWK